MNTEFRVIHFDIVDHGAEPSATERNVAFKHVGAHDLNEGGNFVFGDPRLRPHFGNRAIKGDLRDIALGLDDGGDPVLERWIAGIGNAVLYGLIEADQTDFRV